MREKYFYYIVLKNNEEYYVFPGGGVEDNETIDQAAVREAGEETGLKVTIGKKLWEYINGERTEHFYLIDTFSGELRVGGPEETRQSKDNVYRLEWVPLEKIKKIKLLPEAMKERILEEFLQ